MKVARTPPPLPPRPPSDGLAQSTSVPASSFRQALSTLQERDPDRWGLPPRKHSDGFDWEARGGRGLRRALYAGALLVLLLAGAGAYWLLDGRHDLITLHPSPDLGIPERLDQMSAAVRAPLLGPAEELRAATDQETASTEATDTTTERHATFASDQHALDVRSGERAALGVHIADIDALEPETSVVVRNVPIEARLSKGIEIGPGLWMLRADLLETAEIETGTAPPGRHVLSLELRRPEGNIVSTQDIVLNVAAIPEEPLKPAPEIKADAERAMELPVPKPPLSARREPATGHRPKTVAKPRPRPPVEEGRTARAGPDAKSIPRRAPRRQGEVTVLAAPPAVQGGQQPRLVWPGDDPRQAYPANPPLFLGGAVPGSPQQSEAAPVNRDTGWVKRAFGN